MTIENGPVRNPLSNHPVAAEFHPTRNRGLQPEDVSAWSMSPVWWLSGECGHEWMAMPGSRTRTENPGGCIKCARAVAVAERTADTRRRKAAKNPLSGRAIGAEFHLTKNPLTIEYYSAVSPEAVWWKCGRGHDWTASPKARATTRKHATCPVCSDR